MSTAYPKIQYTRDEDVPVPAGFRELEEGEAILATDQVYDHCYGKWEAVVTRDSLNTYGAEAGSSYRAETYHSTIRHTGAPASFTRDEKRPIPAGFRELEEGETVLVTDLVHDEVSVSGVSWLPHTTLPAGDYRLKLVGDRYCSAGNRQRIRATSIYTTSTGTTAPAADVFPPAIPPAGWRYARIGDKLERGFENAAFLRKDSGVEQCNVATSVLDNELFARTQKPGSAGVFLIKDPRPALPPGYRYLNIGDVIMEGDEYATTLVKSGWRPSDWIDDTVHAGSSTYRRLVQPAATPAPTPAAPTTFAPPVGDGYTAVAIGETIRKTDEYWHPLDGWQPTNAPGSVMTPYGAGQYRRKAQATQADQVGAPAVGDGYRVMLVGEIPVSGDEFWNSCTGQWLKVLPFSASVPLTGLGRYRRKVPTALESALAANAGLVAELTKVSNLAASRLSTIGALENGAQYHVGRIALLEAKLRTETERADEQTARADSAAVQVRHAVEKLQIRDELIEDLNARLAYKEAAETFAATTYTAPAFSAKPYYYPGIVVDVQDQGVSVIAGCPWVGKTFLTKAAVLGVSSDDLGHVSSLQDEVSELKARIQKFESHQVKWHAFWAAFRDLHAIRFYITDLDGSYNHPAGAAYIKLRQAFNACTQIPGCET